VQKSIATLLLLSALSMSLAFAAGLSVSSAAIAPNNEGYFLDADFNLRLNSTLEDALARGVVLYFVIEGRLWRPRWWWFNDTVAIVQETRKLSYNSLTRQYRLSNGPQYENFSALDDAETVLSQVRNWKISDLQSLGKGNRYGGSVRMWLDVTQLPKPFQVKAVTATEWKLDSDEFVFDVNL
jgi:Domain of unknown function (DUF4390)